MKIQLRRFLFAAAIAAGLCSSSQYQKTNAHDFPLRSVACPFADSQLGTTETYCPIDDCTDEAFSSSVGEVQSSAVFPDRGFVAFSRQHIARAASTMALWLDQWDQWQKRLSEMSVGSADNAAAAAPDSLYAAQPDIGTPPAPLAKSVAEFFVGDELPSPLADIESSELCAEPCNPIIPLITREVLADNASCQPLAEPQSVFARNPFAAGVSEEYSPYDFQARDSHWLSGVSRAWDWKSSVQGRLPLASGNRMQQLVTTEIESDAELPLAVPAETSESELCKPPSSTTSEFRLPREICEQETFPPEYSCPQEFETAEVTVNDSAPLIDLHGIAPAIDCSEALCQSLQLLDNYACVWYSELHDLRSLEAAGYKLGLWIVATSQVTTEKMLDLTEQIAFTQPGSIIPPLTYVLYTTIDGVAVVVPADMARAWNIDSVAPDDSPAAEDLASSDEVSAQENSSQINIAETTESLPESDFRAIRSQILIEAAERLDWLGIRLLQVADKLSDWAGPQIAKSSSPSMR